MGKEYEQLRDAIYKIVRKIPKGSVLTYGRIAVFVGRPQNARLIGRLLANCPDGVPAHRVVNASGCLVPGWTEQKLLLLKEGVSFKENGNVNLKKHLL